VSAPALGSIFGPSVGTRSGLDLRSEPSRATDGFVDGGEELQGLGNRGQVERVVLIGGPGQIPGVYQGVGAHQAAHQRFERLLSEGASDRRGGANEPSSGV
jgi:hypothetical protein